MFSEKNNSNNTKICFIDFIPLILFIIHYTRIFAYECVQYTFVYLYNNNYIM